jgi:hypothetical protein
LIALYGSLGQSSKCAGSAIVPANYMSGGAPPAPLTGGGEAASGLSTGAKIALALGSAQSSKCAGLAPRWNAIDPEAPGQACYVA